MPYAITNQRALRRAFWEANPALSPRKMSRAYRGYYHATDTRVTWCDYIDHLARDGQISENLAQRATLDG